ncbi:MAG: hypothetical protein ACKOFF_06620, partial [Acidimicrobiales bacterium]
MSVRGPRSVVGAVLVFGSAAVIAPAGSPTVSAAPASPVSAIAGSTFTATTCTSAVYNEIATVMDVLVDGTDVYIGGCFRNWNWIDAADYIAKWDGSSWCRCRRTCHRLRFPWWTVSPGCTPGLRALRRRRCPRRGPT